MTIDIRQLDDASDLVKAFKLFRAAMVGLPSFGPIDADWIEKVAEPGRTLGVYDGDEIVGTARTYSGVIAVPGGAKVPHAAVTHVGVLSTHRRRGFAAALLKQQLLSARQKGEAIATLRAADARIYSRFGYGIASLSAGYELDKTRVKFHAGLNISSDGIRLVEPQDAWPLLAEIYARQKAPRPGSISRSSFWWNFQAHRLRFDTGSHYVAVHGVAGAEDGYVRYHPIGENSWFFNNRRTIIVDDIVANSPQVYVKLIAHLLSLDLPDVIVFASRPVDDPLPLLFEDFRATSLTYQREETWLRLTDVEAALRARSYRGGNSVVLQVVDELLPENSGLYRISAQGITRTTDEPDVVADVNALGAAYLGGIRWQQLDATGRLTLSTLDAILALDELFAVVAAPHAGTMF